MGQRRPILPPGYHVEPEPTPLSDQEIDRLVGWIRSLDDPYILAYCLYWGFGANAKLLQKTMGDEAVERKIRGFPNLCRRHLRKGTKTIIGFDDLNRIFNKLLETDFEVILLTSVRAIPIKSDNYLAYLDSISKLHKQRKQKEIAYLNRHPSRDTQQQLPPGVNIRNLNISDVILELPEEYEQAIWMYFVERKGIKVIAEELHLQYARGIVEYCRRYISRQLGFAASLDDYSIRKILLEL